MFAGGLLPESRYDVVVVGAGPAGSIAALNLARAGARVGLVDKATFDRDKACGDLIGPRGLALLEELDLSLDGGREVSEMLIVGPTGRRVVLPARAGRTYPGHGAAVPRRRFDAWLRDVAIGAGADPVTGHVVGLDGGAVRLADGSRLSAGVVIGADGATSTVARAAGLVDAGAVLWGFAIRAYTRGDPERPVICLWDDAPGHGFPGYGWLFPGVDGVANVGLGLGVGARRVDASRAAATFDTFSAHLRRLGLLHGGVTDHRLGGWLKMGMVGTVPARDGVLLVGDAAGLVNPLQGEGIAPAMTSARLAASAVLSGPAGAAARYRRALADVFAPYASVAAPIHAAAVAGSSARVSRLCRVLTAPGLSRAIAGPWAVYWNDLRDGAPPGVHSALAGAVQCGGRLLTTASRTRRRLEADLSGTRVSAP
jgi:geranylgeranyl reductase family protein